MGKDICIIGGGAAGMTAAICAKRANPELNVFILEKKSVPGRKILASGNGKCNLSNVNCPNYNTTLAFFQELGLITRVDDSGRIYPYSEDAKSVRDALVRELNRLGVDMVLNSEIVGVVKENDRFVIRASHKFFMADKVLIACGGKAGPKLGSTGDGFRFAKNMGHHVSKPIPVLTAVDVCEDVSSMAGVRVKAGVTLMHEDNELFSEAGEVQFTQTGLSGICVFNLSSFMLVPDGKTMADGFDGYTILLDLFPNGDGLEEMLKDRVRSGFEGSDLLRFMVKDQISDYIFSLAKGDTVQTAKLLRALPLSPKSVKGWDFAQATKGGVMLSEIDGDTMESKKLQGLYFAGEVVDYDGPCGGFNLQNAWETGMKAGRAMAIEI